MTFEHGCHVLCLLLLYIFIQAGMGMTIVDDTDPRWWGATALNGQGRRVGGISALDRSKLPYGFTWHEVLGDGAWASLTFTGTRVNLTGIVAGSVYTTVVDFYIDGQYMTRFEHAPDVSPPFAGDEHILYTMADFDNLSPAEHTLKAISVGADSLLVVDFIAYEPSTAVSISPSAISSVSASPSSGSPSMTGSTNIRSTSSASRTVSTALSASSSQSTQVNSSTSVIDSQPLTLAMDVPASDSSILYSPPEAWSPYSDSRRAMSCLAGTMSSSTVGSYLAYNFTGTTIQVYTLLSSIGGNYSISIDGQNQGIFTTYAASEDPSDCLSRPLYSTMGLNGIQHTLTLTTQDHPVGSMQNTIQFVGFRLSSSTTGAAPSGSLSVSGPKVGAIVGGVVGGLAGFFLVALLVMWWMHRQRQAEEALLAEARAFPAASSINGERSRREQVNSVAGSMSLPRPPVMVQTPSAAAVPNFRSNINDESSERVTYYTLPSYHESILQRPAARNLSESDVEAISRRLRQVMRNQVTLSDGTPSELMPPRELIDHLVQEHLGPRAL